jgi:outer membrane protein TolC
LILASGSLAYSQDTLTLAEAILQGLENNYSIVIQANNAGIARNNNTIGNAGFLPTLDLNATQNNTFSTTHQKTFTGSEKDIDNARNRTFNAGLALSWTLFDGFSMFVTKDMLSVMEQQGEITSRVAVENTLADIILAYCALIQQEKMIQVLRDAAALSLERQKIAQAKTELGSGSKIALLQSTVDLNADSARLIQQITTVKNAKADLNRLIGREASILFAVIGEISPGQMPPYPDLVSRAAWENTDLLLARAGKELSSLDLKNYQSSRYPRINFQAGYNYNQLNSQTGFLEYNQAFGPSFGFTLSYNLFNGFNTNREINNARINLSSAEFHFKDTDMGVRAEIYKLHNNYLSNLELVRLETVNQEVARENVDVSVEKYKLGSISDIDLRETQRKYIEAQYQLLLAQFQAKQAEVELLRISGILFSEAGGRR